MTNSCDCTSQDRAFDLEKYGPYLDKIRALFVPSLEYRVRSLLKEFVYSTDSRWAKQFPCFKKFVDTIATWKGHLNRIAEYDIGTMEEIMRNTVTHVAKDDLITCFLDAIILHHRLNKVCRELDALGIDDNILRSLTVWNFVNERNCLLDRDCLANFNTTTDTGTCNGNLNTVMSADAKGSAKCKKIVPLATSIYDGSAEHVQPTTSEYREHRQIFDSNRNFLQRRKDNSNHYSTCGATGSRDDSAKKANGSLNEEPCESKKIRNNLKLKIIVHKMYLDDYECMTVSSFNVVPLPCKPSHLIKRIFEADPSLSESCLIVMKRKFQDSMYNVCSCLNDVLGKLNIKFINTLCLNCEIYPGYISFKLKSSASNNIKKYFFVARVPICQNIRKRAIQQDSIILSSNSKSSTEVDELKCSEQCKDDGTSLTLEHIDEETEKFDNTHCSRSNQSFLQDILTIDIHETKEKNSNEKKIECITEDASEDITDLTICSCNKSCEEVSNVTSHIDNSEGRNEEYCKVSSSTGINNNTTKESKEKILESNTLIVENDTQLIDNANCMCSSYENSIETSNGTEEIFSNKDLDSFSQATGVNEHDCTCSSDKETNPRNEADNANICRIASFVQNPECDKQLVELNYNCFSNNIKTIDSDAQGDNSSLNSAKVEVGCDSCCSHQSDDVIDITVIDNSSNENIVCTFKTSQDDLNAVKTQSMDYSKATQVSSRNNNLLTVSVQTPRSKISSKRTNISKDTSYPESIRLTFDDYESIPTIVKTKDKHNEIENSSIPALILSKKTNRVLPHINKEVLDMRDGMRDFITSSKGFSTSKKRFNGDSKSSSISTGEYSCMRNQSICATSNASLCCRSFATISEFTMCNRRDEFRKSSDKSRKLSNRREHRLEFHGSWNGIPNVTSTAIKHKRALRKNPDDDYSIEIQPQTIFAITKFRNSVDKSVDRIKRLIRAKLGNILFNNKIDNNSKEKTFWKNEEFSGDSKRQKTSGRCIRQNYSITSCSTCNCCKQSCIRSSCESSNVILPICRNKEKSEKNMKFCNRRSVNGSEVSLNLHSIKTSPWSYNFLTSAVEDIEKQKLNRNNRPRYNKRKKVQNIINYDRNSCRCNFGNSGTSITLSSQSTEMSLVANDSECLGHYTCKRQEETCNNGRSKQVCNRDQQKNEEMRHKYGYGKKEKYQYIPIEYSNDNSIKGSLSHTRRKNARNIHKQFYDESEQKNAKRFASSRKNRQIFEKDTSDCFDNNSLYRRHVFAILTDACNDCMDDLDLDFKLGLLRYVELCKSVKRLLMRTLRSDDIYKVSTMPDSNL